MALRTPAFNDAKSYGFEWLRALLELDGQEGVVGAGDYKVTAAAGGGMRVDIAAGVALVKGDSGIPGTGLSQGLFLEVNDAAVANAVTLAASDPTLPRLDQIVLRVRDSSDLGSGADDAVFEVVQGVATAGTTLDNRNGSAALPNDRLRLADVLVPAASVAVTGANVRDRRPWARGAYRAYSYSGGDVVVSASAWTQILAGGRVELSGAPLRITVAASLKHSLANGQFLVSPQVDGGVLDGTTANVAWQHFGAPVAANNVKLTEQHNTQPAAPSNAGAASSTASGSHLVTAAAANVAGSGTITMSAAVGVPAFLFVEEIVRQNGDNT